MLKGINYRGPLVTDTTVPGERKADGIIPAHANGALRVSPDRFVLFFATLDPGSWDATKSICYQVRTDAPDGPVLTEGLLFGSESGWRGESGDPVFRKMYGMPMAFGVPRGATLNGQPMPNANVFVVKAYRRVAKEIDGILVPRGGTPEDLDEDRRYRVKYQRVEWAQFRLNDAGNDIEILQPRTTLMQKGYRSEDVFCDLGPGRHMNHAMTPPMPVDETCTTWFECDTFDLDAISGRPGHGQIAPVEYSWNPETGLYEWTRVGNLHMIPGRAIGETSISRWDGAWVVASRSNAIDPSTVWYRTDDLFAGLGEPTFGHATWGPRHSDRCADGVLRVFLNDKGRSPGGLKRNPLYVVDVDPVTFEQAEPAVVFDAVAEGLPFHNPFADMSKLCLNQGARQLVVFRCIDGRMTTGPGSDAPVFSDEAFQAAGIHYAELVYDAVST